MRYESSVRGCIVIMEQPIARESQFRSFSPNILLQAAKNIAVEVDVHGLAFRGTHSCTVIGWHSMELVLKLFDTPMYKACVMIIWVMILFEVLCVRVRMCGCTHMCVSVCARVHKSLSLSLSLSLLQELFPQLS
jgi:hypothetical protein